MTQTVWRVRRSWAACGWRGQTGIALLLAGSLSAGLLIPARQAQVAAASAAVSRPAEDSARPAGLPDSGSQVRAFHASLPAVSRTAEDVLALQEIAERAGVQLTAGQYRLTLAGPSLRRYEVQLPVRGAYAQIRDFTAALLDRLPHAAVQALELKRESVAVSAIDARLVIALYYRDAEE